MDKDLLKGVDNSILKSQYESYIVKLIRERYSYNDEQAILRKKLANIDTENEFATYNNYVEECKRKAKADLNYN